MIISINQLKRFYGVKPKTILHIGAHTAEEIVEYKKLQPTQIYWVEAIPELASMIQLSLDPDFNSVICGVAWDSHGEDIVFNIANQKMSSSVYNFSRHKELFPDIEMIEQQTLKTVKLDQVIPLNPAIEFINLDIQGSEMIALKGFQSRLKEVRWIYTEVSKNRLYDGGADFEQLNDYLLSQGFKNVTKRWLMGEGWGEALFTKYTEKGKFFDVPRFIFVISQIVYTLRLTISRKILRRF